MTEEVPWTVRNAGIPISRPHEPKRESAGATPHDSCSIQGVLRWTTEPLIRGYPEGTGVADSGFRGRRGAMTDGLVFISSV